MIAIDLSHNPWHWRFLSFMGFDYQFTARRYDSKNTCDYVSAFFRASLWLMFLTVFWFGVAFVLTFNLIVSSIFVYHLGLSLDAIRAVARSMNPALAAVYIINVGLFCTFFMFVSIYLMQRAVFAFVYSENIFKVTFPSTALREKLQRTSTYQILSAWHNKICLPIKF